MPLTSPEFNSSETNFEALQTRHVSTMCLIVALASVIAWTWSTPFEAPSPWNLRQAHSKIQARNESKFTRAQLRYFTRLHAGLSQSLPGERDHIRRRRLEESLARLSVQIQAARDGRIKSESLRSRTFPSLVERRNWQESTEQMKVSGSRLLELALENEWWEAGVEIQATGFTVSETNAQGSGPIP